MMKSNPFKYGQVVTGEYFTDREEEIRILSEAMGRRGGRGEEGDGGAKSAWYGLR